MKRRTRANSSSLFLIELIISILIFALASAICVSAFARSHTMSEHARAKTIAVNQVGGTAELIRGSKSRADLDRLLRLESDVPGSNKAKSGGSIGDGFESSLFYDVEGKACPENQAVYRMTLKFQWKQPMLSCRISFASTEKADQAIYELDVKKYYGEGSN